MRIVGLRSQMTWGRPEPSYVREFAHAMWAQRDVCFSLPSRPVGATRVLQEADPSRSDGRPLAFASSAARLVHEDLAMAMVGGFGSVSVNGVCTRSCALRDEAVRPMGSLSDQGRRASSPAMRGTK
jgi:hypothetical protein